MFHFKNMIYYDFALVILKTFCLGLKHFRNVEIEGIFVFSIGFFTNSFDNIDCFY